MREPEREAWIAGGGFCVEWQCLKHRTTTIEGGLGERAGAVDLGFAMVVLDQTCDMLAAINN